MKWWGYLHTNGSIVLKRYHALSTAEDIEEAKRSPFVDKVVPPFEAIGREDALNIIDQELGLENKS
jgi:hypothetical protein